VKPPGSQSERSAGGRGHIDKRLREEKERQDCADGEKAGQGSEIGCPCCVGVGESGQDDGGCCWSAKSGGQMLHDGMINK